MLRLEFFLIYYLFIFYYKSSCESLGERRVNGHHMVQQAMSCFVGIQEPLLSHKYTRLSLPGWALAALALFSVEHMHASQHKCSERDDSC